MTIWAKSTDKEKKTEISLEEHTENVLKIFEQIKYKLNNNDNIVEAIKFAIRHHDLGKVIPYFQIKTLGNREYKPFDVTNNIYHSLASVLWINKTKLKQKFDENTSNYILSAIAYHHWRDSFDELLRFGAEKFYRFSKWLENSNSNLLSDNLIKQGFDDEFISFDKEMLNGLSNGVPYSEYIVPPYNLYWLPKRVEIDESERINWILISGFLIRCDHFASFLEKEEDKCEVEIKGINLDDIRNNIIKVIQKNIKNFSGNDERFWQNKFIQNNNDNLILIAPTGSGKTEFSFLWSSGEKFIYTLPLRSAVNQTYNRAVNVFGKDKTGLLHSDADIYYLQEQSNEKDEINRISPYDLSRQLAFPAMITTGDQFFPYALRPPGYEKIFATLYKSRLIMDEIQAYNPKSAAIIVKFIESVISMNGKVLLMTATFPDYIKDEIEKRVSSFPILNLYNTFKEKYKNLIRHKYNLILIDNEKNKDNFKFNFSDEIINEIIENANSGKRVLIILNTIKSAQNLFDLLNKKLKEDLKKYLFLLHSKFTINDRNLKEIEICGNKENSGEFSNPKNDSDNQGKILISTQVVEASLNIDADILYTEIAPLDALVQRMGRVYRRYNEDFIYDKEESNIKIIIFKEGYQSGKQFVYDNELIEKTFCILNSLNDILKENSNLKTIIDSYYSSNKFIGFKEIKNENFLLSEYDKYTLVSSLYNSLDINGKYLKQFYSTLDILDAGYMSDRKADAQRMFRDIATISVIPVNLIDDFIKALYDFKEKNIFSYLNFKNDILSKFVLNISFFKSLNNNVNSEIHLKILSEFDDSFRNKLRRWLSDIYFIDNEYNDKLGLHKSNNGNYDDSNL